MKTATRDNLAGPGLVRAFKSVGLFGVLLSAGSLLVFDEVRSVLSVAAGAAIALLNLWMTAYLVRGFIAPSGIKLPWPLIATLKLVLVFGGVYVLLQREQLSLLPLMVGLGALPLGIVFGQTRPRTLDAKEELPDA